MSARILDETAYIAMNHETAFPSVVLRTRNGFEWALLHQGPNSAALLEEGERDAFEARAFAMAGSLSILADSKQEIERELEFHFLQFMQKTADFAYYAGEDAGKGSIKYDFAAAPAYPPGYPILLDALVGHGMQFPFVDYRHQLIYAGDGNWTCLIELYDHPHVERILDYENFAAKNVLNYLYEVRRATVAHTFLVVKNKSTKALQNLGYVTWKSDLWANIEWRRSGKSPPTKRVTYNKRSFTSEKFARGFPNKEAEKLFNNLPRTAASTFNDINEKAAPATYRTKVNNGNVEASDKWTASVPRQHFKS